MNMTKSIPDDRLADFTTDRRVLLLSAVAVLIGALSAVVAWVLVWLISVITNLAFFQRLSSASLSPSANQLGLWVVFVPIAGGLIIGLMARYGSEKIRGHGIPEALEAILIDRSRMGPKVAALKPISSAISIGTGGPFGAEGPIIMTGGALGSLIAQLLHLSAAERKTLLVAGAAGGMAAIFATPVAAVLLAVELLLFEWKPRSFIPVALSAAVAAILRVPLLGMGPIFPVTPHVPLVGMEWLIAFALGILAGLGSALLTMLVYWCEDAFKRVPLHWMWWPALGGLAIGLGALVEPRVLGVGYDTIGALLSGKLLGLTVLGLLVAKAVVWSVALGSGTSGGVLAPLLIMGGALGSFAAGWIPVGDAGLWAMVGMAAMMGGTMRAPLTAMVFTLELTHDLNALPALFAGCIAAYAVTVLLMRRSILTEKVARRGHHLIREYSIDPFEVLRVGEIMDRNAPTLPASLTVRDLLERLTRGDPQLLLRQGHPIVDAQGKLAGIITRGDLARAVQTNLDGDTPILEAGTRELVVAYPDETLRQAVNKMLAHGVGRLLVVSRDNPGKLVGYLGRSGLMAARLRELEHESLRERTWPVAPGTRATAQRPAE